MNLKTAITIISIATIFSLGYDTLGRVAVGLSFLAFGKNKDYTDNKDESDSEL